MLYTQERQLIVDTCKYLQSINFFIGTWGNVSLRLNNHILLTPSRIEYALMKPEDVVLINLDGSKVEGRHNPTSEKEVHRQIYCVRDDVNAIIHVHTTYAMAVSTLSIKEVPCIVEEMSQLLGGSIPLTEDYIPAAQHAELGSNAAKCIKDRNGVLLRNHGSVCCGQNIDEAVLVAKVVEKACEIFLSTHGSYRPIPDEYVKSEHLRYLYTYGKEDA